MSRTILVADDSVTIQKVVELTFMGRDYQVVVVGSGDEALAKLDEASPDLVIADVHMPGADGYEVCRRVKRDRPRTPVLLLVGTFEPFDPSDVEASGADAHLKKPFDSQELFHLVEDLLREAGGAEAEAEAEAAPPAAEELAVPAEEGGFAADAPEPLAAPLVMEPPAETAAAASSSGSPGGGLSEEDVERISRRVVEMLSESAVRDVAWEVVPDLAEVVIRDRLRELESQVE